ncbi:hypothetical protein Acr_16g0000450 [Actinidia rufa]|uniref:Transposase (putative) gypsy type domain-containing protein n=1 Tax=Actinidia rufa TaxID=165716 RepID=A0A7J0FXJ7_9ERIC|nr:hypothetical protein Acr_16g0000450 [Actinidia rufa]
MFSKTNLGGEESEQSLPSWISDHLGLSLYIDETSQSPSFLPTNSPKMDTSSLTKEGNAMSQAELDKLGSTYSFPSGIRLRIPGDGETILSARQGEVAFYEAAFLAGLRLPLHPTIREILIHYKICPAQLSPNAWRSVICSLVVWRHFKRHMSCDEFRGLYSLSPLPDSGWYYFKARPEKNLFRGSPSNVKGWKTRFFFASGDEWEFPSGVATSDITARVPRSWGTPGKSCNKLPTLSEVDAERTEAIFGKIEPGGYFEVFEGPWFANLQQTFCGWLHGALYQCAEKTRPRVTRVSSLLAKTRLNTLGVIRRDIEGSDSGSVSISDSELPPAQILMVEGKAKAEKATTSQAKLPPKESLSARNVRGGRANPNRNRIGERTLQRKRSCAAPRLKDSNPTEGRSMLKGVLVGRGTSSPGGDMGSESMSDASVARRLLTGVIPASDKKEVDQLSENKLVAKSFHALGQVVVFASSLALRSQEHLHDMDSIWLARIRPSLNYEGFEFCKRQLLHQFPNLGVDVANMAMDPSFAEEEEAMKGGEDPVAGVAPIV